MFFSYIIGITTTITGAQSPSTTTCTPPRLTPLQEYLLMMKRFFQQFRPYPQPQRPPGFLEMPQIPLEQRFGLSPPQIQPHRPINNLIGWIEGYIILRIICIIEVLIDFKTKINK